MLPPSLVVTQNPNSLQYCVHAYLLVAGRLFPAQSYALIMSLSLVRWSPRSQHLAAKWK